MSYGIRVRPLGIVQSTSADFGAALDECGNFGMNEVKRRCKRKKQEYQMETPTDNGMETWNSEFWVRLQTEACHVAGKFLIESL